MNSEQPLVSVIIPTYNRADLLSETLHSVQAQTYTNWEAIVVDDGSTDNTEKLDASYSAKDERIRFFKRQGEIKGANVCRNQGMKASRGDLILFLDSDDLLAPCCLTNRIEILKRNPDIGAVFAPAFIFEDNVAITTGIFGKNIGAGDLDSLLVMRFPFQTSSPLWRKSALSSIGNWDETLPSWQDVDYFFRMLVSGIWYQKLCEPDFFFRSKIQNVDSYEKTSINQFLENTHLWAAEKLFKSMSTALQAKDWLTWQRAHYIAGFYLLIAECWLRKRDIKKALNIWRQAYRDDLIGRRVYYQGVFYIYLNYMGINKIRLFENKYKRWKWHWRLAKGNIMV